MQWNGSFLKIRWGDFHRFVVKFWLLKQKLWFCDVCFSNSAINLTQPKQNISGDWRHRSHPKWLNFFKGFNSWTLIVKNRCFFLRKSSIWKKVSSVSCEGVMIRLIHIYARKRLTNIPEAFAARSQTQGSQKEFIRIQKLDSLEYVCKFEIMYMLCINYIYTYIII